MNIREQISLADLTTFGTGGISETFIEIESLGDVPEVVAFLKDSGSKPFVLGGGSNVVIKSGSFARPVLHPINDYIETIKSASGVLVRVGAGVVWDDLCRWAVENNLHGIESLSLIPGSVGASPVQNIGAYGAEVGDVLQSVTAFELETGKVTTFGASEISLGYRTSMFRAAQFGRYCIMEIVIKLEKRGAAKIPDYKDVHEYFAEHKKAPTLAQIREAIINIRQRKLPDPRTTPNAGSFFKNPIVGQIVARAILKKFPEAPNFPVGDKVKIPAGWLMETAGWKGRGFADLQVSPNHALVLTNPNREATLEQVKDFVEKLNNDLDKKFGITLEHEPLFIE